MKNNTLLYIFGGLGMLVLLSQAYYSLQLGHILEGVLVFAAAVVVAVIMGSAGRPARSQSPRVMRVVFETHTGQRYRVDPNPIVTRVTCLKMLRALERDGNLKEVHVLGTVGMPIADFTSPGQAEKWFKQNLP